MKLAENDDRSIVVKIWGSDGGLIAGGKRLMLMLVLIGLMLLPGCSGVWMNAEYSALLTSTASLSAETASRAQIGQLSPDEMKSALVDQSNTWAKFVAARDGSASTQPAK
jgi:hypothetical protein